ncbi:hypothetical protein SCOR_32645 [Sulfidibacter corallicola]
MSRDSSFRANAASNLLNDGLAGLGSSRTAITDTATHRFSRAQLRVWLAQETSPGDTDARIPLLA